MGCSPVSIRQLSALLQLLLWLLLLLQLPGHSGQQVNTTTTASPLTTPTPTPPPTALSASPAPPTTSRSPSPPSTSTSTSSPATFTDPGGDDGVTAGTGVPSSNVSTAAAVPAANSTGGDGLVVEEEEEVEEEEDWSPAEAYFYTGDAATLALSTCPRSFRQPPQRGRLPPDLWHLLRPMATSLANAANFLNLIFQASELREITVREDLEWYHALVRSMLEADRPGLVRRAMLTFDADPMAARPQLFLRASRGPRDGATRVSIPLGAEQHLQEILLQDFTTSWDNHHLAPPAPDDSWFTALKFADRPQVLAGLSKRALVNDLVTLETPKWARGDSWVANWSSVRWANATFLECQDGRFLPGWLLMLTMPFYGLKPDLTPEFRGVLRLDVNVQGYDIDQCATGDVWFADTHECDRTSMMCEPIPGQGFRLGQYCCRCKEGYYSPQPGRKAGHAGTRTSTNGGASVNTSTRACYPSMPVCLPCYPGCGPCTDGSPCWVQEDWLLRSAVLVAQGLLMLLVFLSMLITYQHRGIKRIRASGLLLLETVLFGSMLLYFPVFILFFRPSPFRCILLRWVRLLGYTIVYGTLTLKMYRVLKVFLSRTAQRIPYMSSTSLLRLLGVMVAVVSWFLCAWTAGVLQNSDRDVPLLVTSVTSAGQRFNQCDIDRWDYMMAFAERLFLCWGLFLCSAARPVPSAFHEPRYMSIAIHNEMVLSCLFFLLRFANHNLHPDWILLLEFTHTHATVTVTLGLLFIPKFLQVSRRPGRDTIAAEVYEDEVDLRRTYLNNSINSAWSDRSVEPEDIRDELKKLYSQLEVHKGKNMANNNPHISKKRSSRLGIGRSIIKHLSRQHSRDDRSAAHSPSPSMFSTKRPSIVTYITDRSPNMTPKSPSHSINPPSRTPSFAGSLTPILVDKRASQYSQHSQHSHYSQLSQHSQQSQPESLDAAPATVYKSASAHNLAVDKNFLQPPEDTSRHQKSLSAVVTSTDYYHMMEEGASQSSAAATPVLRHVGSIKEQTTSALQSESFDKTEVCPWDVEEERRPSKKHVTYDISDEGGGGGGGGGRGEVAAPVEKEQGQSPGSSPLHSPVQPNLIICPWANTDTLPSAQKQKSVDSADSDGESARLKAPISASAPVSPSANSGKPKDLRVFSFRAATKSLLHAKSLTIDKTKLTATTSVGTGEVGKKTPQLQKRSMTTIDLKPALVKQAAVRLPSTDSGDRSPVRKTNPEVMVCPWESDSDLAGKPPENVYVNVLTPKGSLKSVGSEAGGRARPAPPPRQMSIASSSGATLQVPARQPSIVIRHSSGDVCPWDTPQPQGGSGGGNPDVCPWDAPQPEASVSVCPWDAPDAAVPQTRKDSLTVGVGGVPGKPAERVIYVRGAPPSPTAQQMGKSPAPPRRQSTVSINICPWEGDSIATAQDAGARSNVCPWETDTPPAAAAAGGGEVKKLPLKSSLKKTSQLTKQTTSTAEACPWDFPQELDPGKLNICPWEADSPKPPLSKQTAVVHSSQDSIDKKADLPPQAQDSSSARGNVCPWETEDAAGPAEPAPKKAVGSLKKTATSVKATISLARQASSTAEQTCPWDFPAPPPVHPPAPPPASGDVCPWDTEEAAEPPPTGTVKRRLSRQDTSKVRLSSVGKQYSGEGGKGSVCPWETQEPEPESANASVCPWETESAPKPIPKQDSTKADVCPWETGSEPQKPLQKQGSTKADVCPWETESVPPKTLQKQGSTKADVCPWEMESAPPKTLPKQDSTRADVCPWETGGSAKADVCPWETGDTETQPTGDQTPAAKGSIVVKADVCPWETGGQEETKPDEGATTDSTAAAAAAQMSTDQEPVQSPTLSVTDTDGMRSPLERRDALCPWASERSEHDNNSDVFTWEENIPEEDEDLDAECAAEAFVFPADL